MTMDVTTISAFLPAASAFNEANVTVNETWTNLPVHSTEPYKDSENSSVDMKNVCLNYQLVMYCGIIGFLFSFGLLGNSLSVFTMWPKRNTNATSFLLIVLAFLDSLLLIVWFLQLAIPAYCNYHDTCRWYIKYHLAYVGQYGWPVGTICHLGGAWVVLLVTGHRYIAVCYPLKVVKWGSVKMARIQVALICSVSFLFCLPRFFDDYIVTTATGAVSKATRMKNHFSYGILYNVVLYYALIYVIPFTMLIYMTYKLIVSLRAALQKREQMTRSKRDEEDMTQTLVVVVLVFMICQLANPIRRLLVEVIPPESRGCGSFYFFYSPISSALICSNCAANFVIYCVFGRRFRQTLKRRLYWVFKRGVKIDPDASVTLHTQSLEVPQTSKRPNLNPMRTDTET